MDDQHPARTIVLLNGDLPGLVALACAREDAISRRRSGLPLALAFVEPGLGAAALRACREQARQMGSTLLDTTAADPARGLQLSGELLRLAEIALRSEVTELIWPAHAGFRSIESGPDVDELACAMDRAELISRLVTLDASELGQTGFELRAPFIDLVDDQIADLAVDLGVPVETCWWWPDEGRPLPDAGAIAERWLGALERAGWTRPASAVS